MASLSLLIAKVLRLNRKKNKTKLYLFGQMEMWGACRDVSIKMHYPMEKVWMEEAGS